MQSGILHAINPFMSQMAAPQIDVEDSDVTDLSDLSDSDSNLELSEMPKSRKKRATTPKRASNLKPAVIKIPPRSIESDALPTTISSASSRQPEPQKKKDITNLPARKGKKPLGPPRKGAVRSTWLSAADNN